MPDLTDRLVVISCGATKAPHPARPADLYTGSYFRACLATALACTQDRRDRVLILSAWHGLLHLDGPPVWPYSMRLGERGAIGPLQLRAQADTMGLLGERVTAMCGKPYADMCRHVWADVTAPLAGLGIGQQLAAMKRWRCTLAAVQVTSG